MSVFFYIDTSDLIYESIGNHNHIVLLFKMGLNVAVTHQNRNIVIAKPRKTRCTEKEAERGK